jgi:hypothetical protein
MNYHSKEEVNTKRKKTHTHTPSSITFTHFLVLLFFPTYNLFSILSKSPHTRMKGILILIFLFHKPHKVHIPLTNVSPYAN